MRLPAFPRRPTNTPRNGDIHLGMALYVRDQDGRTVRVELAPQASAQWAVTRTLIALEDPRDPADCTLLLRGEPLRPNRSLQAQSVHNGDTLDLIPAYTTARSRRTSRLRYLWRN